VRCLQYVIAHAGRQSDLFFFIADFTSCVECGNVFVRQLYIHVSLFDVKPHFYIAVHVSTIHTGAAKSNPLKLFAVFSATALDFCGKFYLFTWLSCLHLTAKWNLVIFKYDEIIDILARQLSNVCALKNVCAETAKQSR